MERVLKTVDHSKTISQTSEPMKEVRKSSGDIPVKETHELRNKD